MPSHVLLDDRGILTVSGPDRIAFLQGLTSNDMSRVTPKRAVFSAFLTPQGKYLHDFIVLAPDAEMLALDCEAERRADLLRRLRPYRLRSKVEIADATESWAVVALFGNDAAALAGLPEEPGAARPIHGGVAAVDPRLAGLGVRLLLPRERADAILAGFGSVPADRDTYETLRLALGVPAGSRDVEVEKSTLLEAGYDELQGISWDKGCYMGQELTARTKYRGLLKRRLVPVRIEGPLPAPGTPVTGEDGKVVGELRGGLDNRALALLRVEVLDSGGLKAGDALVSPERPVWAAW